MNPTLRKVLAGLGFLTAISWFFAGAIIGGIGMTLVSVLVWPGLADSLAGQANKTLTRPMKTGAFVLSLVVMIYGVSRAADALASEETKKDEQATVLELEGRRLLQNRDVAGALAKFTAAQKLAKDSHRAQLESLMDKTKNYADEESMKRDLADLTDLDYARLKDGTLEWPAAGDSSVGKFYVAQMAAIADQRPALMKAREAEKKAAAELAARTEREAKEAEAKAAKMQEVEDIQKRREFAARMREAYLDNNADIKVIVSGKKADRVTLSWPLMGDVWTHKFKKGDLSVYQAMGFKRIDITDDYDYHVYFEN